MKIKPTNLPHTRKKDINPLECFNTEKPSEISEEDWEEARTYASHKPDRIPSNIRELAYRRFYQQYSFDDIATKYSLEVGCVIYTAIFDDWFTKVKKEKRVRGSESMERADKGVKELLNDILEATSAAYTHQLRTALEDPTKSAECGLIPKNLKEVQILVSLIQSLQSKEVPVENKTPTSVTNVNVQNLIAGNNGVSRVSESQPNSLKELPSNANGIGLLVPYEDDNEDQDDALDLLLRAKNGIPE